MGQPFVAGGHSDDRPALEDIDDFDDDIVADDLADDDPDSDDEDDDDDYEEIEDATDEEIDFVVALYREDGQAMGVALDPEYANDFDEFIAELTRLPGDAGALGFVSIDSDVLVAVRVRGPRHVQVFVSDVYFADEWPIVHDAVDFLGLDPGDGECPDDGPVGDLAMFADQGLSEMDLEAICMDDEDLSSEDLAQRIAKVAHFGSVFQKAVDDFWAIDE